MISSLSSAASATSPSPVAKYEGEDWWRWSMWLDAKPGELERVKKVVWHLHPTFPQPTRTVTDAETNFRLDTAGWGTFEIKADVVFTDGKTRRLSHEPELLYPGGISNDE